MPGIPEHPSDLLDEHPEKETSEQIIRRRLTHDNRQWINQHHPEIAPVVQKIVQQERFRLHTMRRSTTGQPPPNRDPEKRRS